MLLLFHDFVVDFTAEFACAISVEILKFHAKWWSLVDAHDELAREEIFKLNCLKYKMVLRDQVQGTEVEILLKFLKHDLLLGEGFL